MSNLTRKLDRSVARRIVIIEVSIVIYFNNLIPNWDANVLVN